MNYSAIDIMQIRDEMHEWNGTSEVAMAAGARHSAREARRLARERDNADDVLDAYLKATERGSDLSTSEVACKSVVAIMLPWIVQWLFKAAIERIVIWLWNRTQKKGT